MSANLISSFEFCKRQELTEGHSLVADLPRLVSECTDASGELHWSLRGRQDKFAHAQLDLIVTGEVHLRCQRCLQPFAYSIMSESTLILAADEAAADEIEALIEDDGIDVIVAPHQMDVLALVEDDALLALPFAPKHDACTQPAVGLTDLESELVNDASPFAQLKKLKEKTVLSK
ncbi:MAG: YceD family protein [Herbaspirillum sp.]